MADSYQVTAAAIVVPIEKTERYLYKGAVLPSGVAKKDIDRLLDTGLIAKVKAATTPTRSSGGSGGDGKPHANANEEKWREYATSLGIEVPADADKAKIRELVDAHAAYPGQS